MNEEHPKRESSSRRLLSGRAENPARDSEGAPEEPDDNTPRSPLHPTPPGAPEPPQRLVPNPPPLRPRAPQTPPAESARPTPDDAERAPLPEASSGASEEERAAQTQRDKVERALTRLREKMAQVATEFAAGRINRAQFHAIYSRYNEQRTITERLLERNPDSQAWQQVVQEGHTAFLRQHYEARVLSYVLYDNESSMPIASHGRFKIDTGLLVPMLSAFRSAATEMFGAGLKSTAIEGGRWLVFVPGEFTTAIVLFSLEPSARQLDLVQDLHRDFERANRQALARGEARADRLVFPQRALFERNP
ncbi:MAG: hypothetical protein Kow00120_12610 [Anaerolineae bacterium]